MIVLNRFAVFEHNALQQFFYFIGPVDFVPAFFRFLHQHKGQPQERIPRDAIPGSGCPMPHRGDN